MTTTVEQVDPEALERFKAVFARRVSERTAAMEHPAGLLDHVKCIDPKTGETFTFTLNDPTAGWYWQREVLDGWMGCPLNLVLKARQIGITWLGAGYGLWKLLTMPGTRMLVISINEDEAIKVVNRLYDMFMSLPEHLRFEAEILKPTRGARPTTLIELVFPDGRISSVVGLPSTRRAGHGETATLVLLDEFARHEFARESWKATFPTVDNGGQSLIVSTANGVSNAQTDEGNFFHHLWVNAETYGIETQFLAWDLHPERDEGWYERNAKALPAHDRAEQFPRTPRDAFIHTGECWFDIEALGLYEEKPLEPELRMRFFSDSTGTKAKIHPDPKGWIRVYERPDPERNYAIGADVATGRGLDYSAAYVVDLTQMKLVAEFHAKIDADEYAEQLHFLGKWYGDARLYRHTIADRPDAHMLANYGFPINAKTRPQLINQLEQAIRERLLPAMPAELIMECRTFIRQKTLPSPRAMDGNNDDRVMSCALALEMYRQYGTHERRARRTPRKAKTYSYPWQRKRRVA
jgi:truncated hemoglobin YjbI